MLLVDMDVVAVVAVVATSQCDYYCTTLGTCIWNCGPSQNQLGYLRCWHFQGNCEGLTFRANSAVGSHVFGILSSLLLVADHPTNRQVKLGW
jgi:hypothetical protein